MLVCLINRIVTVSITNRNIIKPEYCFNKVKIIKSIIKNKVFVKDLMTQTG
jgi:hypothetical protein